MNKDIVPGYQLHVYTWENDGDAGGTKIVSGLTKPDVQFFLTVLGRLHSNNYSPKETTCFGNGPASCDELNQIINDAFDKHPDVSESIRAEWADLGDAVWEAICETLLGYPVSEFYYEEENFCRVFSRFEVFLIPQKIQNVTTEFE